MSKVPAVSSLRLQTKSKFTPKISSGNNNSNNSNNINNNNSNILENEENKSLLMNQKDPEEIFLSSIQSSQDVISSNITFEDLLKPILNSVTIVEDSTANSSSLLSVNSYQSKKSAIAKRKISTATPSSLGNGGSSISISNISNSNSNNNNSNATIEPKRMADFLKDCSQGVLMSRGGRRNNHSKTNNNNNKSPEVKEIIIPKGSTASHLVAPQVKLVDGKIVVDTEFIPLPSSSQDQSSMIKLDLIDANQERHLTSHAFVRHSGPNRWTIDQTIEFYRALQMCGTDFSQMTVLFPDRTREQLKAKFRLEERIDPDRLNKALRCKMPFDREWMNRVNKNTEIKEGLRKRGRPTGTNTF